jgi:branched-chain amino acid transport system permease protein
VKGLSARELLARLWPVLVCWALILLVVIGGQAAGFMTERVAITTALNVIFVIGLAVFVGLSGLFSFSHAGFMAIGAYTFGLLTIPVTVKDVVITSAPDFLVNLHLPILPALLVGGAVAAALAAVLSVPLMRMSGLAAALATLVILIVIVTVARNWEPVTNGTSGLTAIPIGSTLGNVLPWALGAVAVAFGFQMSRLGTLLRGSREDEVAAASVGVDVANARRLAFVLSAFVLGVGGALYARFLGAFTPDAFYLNITFLVLAMLVIGGRKSLSGAVVGALIVSIASELLRQAEAGVTIGPLDIPGRPGLSSVVLALVLLGILLLRPRGVMGAREFPAPKRLRSGQGEQATEATGAYAFHGLAKRQTTAPQESR